MELLELLLLPEDMMFRTLLTFSLMAGRIANISIVERG